MRDSIVSALKEYASRRPDRAAVIANGEQLTYAQLWKDVQGFAAYIASLGFEKQSRIIVKASTTVGFAVTALAIHLSGNVHVPLEKTIGPEGLNTVIDELGAVMAISDIRPKDGAAWVDSARVCPVAEAHYRSGLTFGFPTPEMICDIMFTTGTTGKSKGVMESHRAVVAVAENVQYGAEIPDDNVYLIPAPINHASAIRKLYVSILTGTTAVLLDGYTDVRKFFRYIEDYGVTSVLMPPSAVRMILTLSGKQLAKYSGSLHHIHTGSAAFPEADKERLCSLLPDTRLYFAYGSSEAGCVSMFDYSRHRGLISCVGKPNKNADIFIVDDEHRRTASDKEHTGLIAISGPVVMSGYFNEPELTKTVLRDGVIYTNDIGYIDENGFVYMLGRRGDVINLGGLKIAPTEVENIALRFPGVADCACFAAEDRLTGAVLKLNVVPEKGAKIDPRDLALHMETYLEAYKIPKKIELTDAIPKTPNGKTDRKRLR